MSTRNQIERNLFGDFGIGPEDIARTIRAEVTSWRSAETDPEKLKIRMETLRHVAGSLGDQVGALNVVFDHHRFMQLCGFGD